MTVEVNGERLRLDEGASLADALAASGADPGERGLAAALDGEVVPRARWGETRLRDGQRLEVVQAVQGG
jgi:sulfur carrier protein